MMGSLPILVLMMKICQLKESQVNIRSIGVRKRKVGVGGKEELTTDLISVEELHKLNQKNVSSLKMETLIKSSGIMYLLPFLMQLMSHNIIMIQR